MVLGQLLAQQPELGALVQRMTPAEQRSLVAALRAAYDAGAEQSDQRTGRLMARIFGGFVGVTPGCDQQVQQEAPRSSLAGFVRLLGSAVR
jgi:hypothetical protein